MQCLRAMSTLTAVEYQIFQDMDPRTRPTIGRFCHDGYENECQTVMTPGSAAQGMERLTVVVNHAVRVSEDWFLLQARIKIENMFLSDARPCMLFYGVTDIPSGICYFPKMGPSGTKFGGIHSLTVRCVGESHINI